MNAENKNEIDYEQYTGVTVNGITNVPDQIIKLGKRLIRVAKNSKKPIDNWSKISRDYIDDELTEHLQNNGNYGVKTGDGLVVVDLDSPEMVAKKDDFPRTFTVKTGKGYHLYYFVDINFSKKNCDGFDLLSNGAFAVGLDSVNEDGVVYTVIDDTDIIHTDINNLLPILGLLPTVLHKTKNNTICHSEEHLAEHSELSQSDTGVGSYYGLNDDKEFTQQEYYIRKGLNFIEIFDTNKLLKVNRRMKEDNSERIYYVTKGNVHRAPNDYINDDVDLVLSKTAINSIRRLGKITEKRIFLILYRVSERYIAVEKVSEHQYSEYLAMNEEQLQKRLPAIRTGFKSKLNNFSKYKKYPILIDGLIKGDIDTSIDDLLITTLFYKAVELGKTNNEIHRMSETYFGTRYDKQETDAQIQHAKRKLET